MLSFAIFTFCLIVILAVRQLSRIGVLLVATVADLNAALDTQTTSITTLAAAVANIGTPPDLQPTLDHITANTVAVDAITASLPPAP